MRIYAHNVEQCIIHGFAFSVWDDGGDFKVLNRGNNTWPEVKDVLVHYHPDSPNQIFSTFSTDPVTEAPTVLLEWNNRTTSTSNIIVERSIAGTNNFLQVSELASDATSFLDENVNENTTYDYRMYTTRMDGTLLHGYPTRVRVIGGTQTPYNDSPIPIPGILEVEEYDNGGEGLSYHDTEPANIPNGFRQDEGVDIGAFGSGFILEYVAQGEWIEYTVNVAQAGTYSVSAELASEVSFGGFNITFDSNNSSTSFNAPNTGSWTVFQTTMANQEIELTEGVQVMRLNITSNNPFNIDRLEFNLEVVNASDLEVDDLSFKVGPNPTDGLVQIQIEEALVNQNPHLEIFNMMGEKMGNFKINGSITNLDLSHLVGGIYMVQLVKDNLRLERRVVIH